MSDVCTTTAVDLDEMTDAQLIQLTGRLLYHIKNNVDDTILGRMEAMDLWKDIQREIKTRPHLAMMVSKLNLMMEEKQA